MDDYIDASDGVFEAIYASMEEYALFTNSDRSQNVNTCKVVNSKEEDDELGIFECDVTSCCSIGPIVRENYCSSCGKKIIR